MCSTAKQSSRAFEPIAPSLSPVGGPRVSINFLLGHRTDPAVMAVWSSLKREGFVVLRRKAAPHLRPSLVEFGKRRGAEARLFNAVIYLNFGLPSVTCGLCQRNPDSIRGAARYW